ncbi:ABC-2 type transport system ATP-binding protein [Crossiella equi]|uniref:ABC-2 type transport system ATP-binding protein n=1 Tax=Crossiella equi TaxID=130796 RepID=A0ABS5A435_9PSEU|nr:ABC transporter ATP-binding protein [Crossiella equi]MBP2471331.1 ABC-2 type transport system ATP-binding protein [Crossiella equi]
MHDVAIDIDALTKDYGRRRALDALTLRIRTGEVFGFLGPNGAGKTTTIRILLDLLRPTSGSARILGLDVRRQAMAVHSRLAYVPGDVALWPQLTGGQAVDALLALHGHRADPAVRAELLDRFQLDPTQRCRTYSKGNRQKVALVAAFAAQSELLILDEPTSGLDPLMGETFRDCVREARAQGRTLFLSSHILGEVESICDRVGVLRAGKLVDHGTLDELRHLSAYTVRAELARPVELAGLPGVSDAELTDLGEGRHRLTCRAQPGRMDELLTALAGAGVHTLTSRPPTLEELFLGYYTEERA